MKDRIYRIFVNRVPGIRERYLQKRIQKGRLAALFALFWLNIQYYLLFRKSLRQPDEFPYYEEKQLYSKASESSLSCGENPEAFADRLRPYKTSKGAIQFPYEKPLPLELIGEIAKWCEQEARA